MSELSADAAVSETEACGALGLDGDQLEQLIEAGPFSRPLSVSKVFGIAMVCTLRMLSAEDALNIAISASQDARMSGTPRLLAVGWRHHEPAGAWLSGGVPAGIAHGLFVLPCDKWLRDIAVCIAAFRRQAAAPPN